MEQIQFNIKYSIAIGVNKFDEIKVIKYEYYEFYAENILKVNPNQIQTLNSRSQLIFSNLR